MESCRKGNSGGYGHRWGGRERGSPGPSICSCHFEDSPYWDRYSVAHTLRGAPPHLSRASSLALVAIHSCSELFYLISTWHRTLHPATTTIERRKNDTSFTEFIDALDLGDASYLRQSRERSSPDVCDRACQNQPYSMEHLLPFSVPFLRV
jgi:hypothetical protein